MRTAMWRGAVLVLALGGLAGVGVREAHAQVGVPYGPYSMTRSQFNQYAPVYYPRLNTNNLGFGYGFGYYGGPRFYGGPRYRYRSNNFSRGFNYSAGRRFWRR